MEKIIKTTTAIAIVFILTIILIGNNKTNAKEKEKTRKEEINKYENIVFLGDSITEFYPIDEIYGDLPIIKSGIAGYRTDDLLPKLEEMVYRYNPTSVYLLIGTNDLLWDKVEDKIKAISNIKKIVESIKSNRKKTKIYIESIYPVNVDLDTTRNMVGYRENETIIEVNKEIEKYCRENNYIYINMYDELIDEDGNLNKKYTDDGLHPNSLGYAKITRVLLPYIYGVE